MSSTTCEAGGRAFLPAVRRVMQLGSGPPALAGWLRARGVRPGPRPEWTADDERTARALARQLDDEVGPNAVGGRLAPRTHQPKDTLQAV